MTSTDKETTPGTATQPLTHPQPYEEISHTADLTIEVQGADPSETLARLVLALADQLCGGGELRAHKEVRIEVEPGELVIMAIDVLREVLYRFATRGEIPERCGVVRVDESAGTKVVLRMGRYDERLHGGGSDIKAVTYHQPRFEKTPNGVWVARVTLDI